MNQHEFINMPLSQFNPYVYFQSGILTMSKSIHKDAETELALVETLKYANSFTITDTHRSKAQGCMLGLAIGDALGAPAEFLTLEAIRATYGPLGIDKFHRWNNFLPGSYTDDTQMSIATGMGYIRYVERGLTYGANQYHRCMHGEYMRWRYLQKFPYYRRAPGMTCMNALPLELPAVINFAQNDSKGCGGVMRVAPLGMVFKPGHAFNPSVIAAKFTHGHPTGYLTAGFLAELIAGIMSGKSLEQAIDAATAILKTQPDHDETLVAVQKARDHAAKSISIDDGIVSLGAGWVADEALAIALFCALRFPGDFKTGVLASVNHSGDSDSTGCITGAILGTLLGLEAIPKDWVEYIEDTDDLRKLALEMLKLSSLGFSNDPTTFERPEISASKVVEK